MRIYKNFIEAIPEIKRDLVEMGIHVHSNTYQDKDIKDNPDFDSMELQNEVYSVVNSRSEDLSPTQPWAEAEWNERLLGINGHPVNSGTAWKLRKEIWEQFLEDNREEDKTFAYTYSIRLSYYNQVHRVIEHLKTDPESRQMFISIWEPDDIREIGGRSRVPCSLGYLIQIRRGKVNMTYLERSADFAIHFVNDVYLAVKLQGYISDELHLPVGSFTHWIGSLHIFKKDALGVF